MLGALDLVIHHQPVGKVHLFVGAKPIGAIDPALEVAVDGEGAPVMVEADDILFLDVVERADRRPVGHEGPPAMR